ncbi:MAG: hypothetical protein M1828_006274 [Chrysothrix sp. TS-e1954]|nr:MAG: hypothetical protein M1828_006274 [Chrysothrix sp. TS-e1954]
MPGVAWALPDVASGVNEVEDIAFLEQQVYDSDVNLNKIATLYQIAQQELESLRNESTALPALCRIFCRLLRDGRLSRLEAVQSPSGTAINQWLNKQLKAYNKLVCRVLKIGSKYHQDLGLTIGMELVSAYSKAMESVPSHSKNDLFGQILDTILERKSSAFLCSTYVKTYAQRYEDVRLMTFTHIAKTLGSRQGESHDHVVTANALSLLSNMSHLGQPNRREVKTLFKAKSPSSQAQMKQAQIAWTRLLSRKISKAQRKHILQILTTRIVPWFRKCELLMDFLDDAFQAGGATALLCLSGIFYLVRKRNLDYPDFYTKLYSLLDDALLHSRHRSDFFRLLSTFMSSSHLPAVLVASFIKRLARLAVHAAPAGIVAVLPWIYNMLASHTACSFMIHRNAVCNEELLLFELEGAVDPFSELEVDPMKTSAIESSLWELVALQSHFHPNVASLARIISEQFTKQTYDVEHFLDYSYDTLIEVELHKQVKKTPEVEYRMSKDIFQSGDTTPKPLWAEQLL